MADNNNNNEIDLRRFLRGIRKLAWLYGVCLVVFISLGVFYWKTGMPLYQTYSAMLIEDSSKGGNIGGGMMSLMRTFSVGGFGSSSANNEVILVNSQDVLMRTVKDLGLNRTYIRKNGLKKKMLFKDTPVILEAPQAMMDTLSDGCTVTVDIHGNSADIAVTQGRFFKSTFSEVKDVTLPASVKTPFGPVQILRTDHFRAENDKIVIYFCGFKQATDDLRDDLIAKPENKLSDGIWFEYVSPNAKRNEAILNSIMGVYNDKRLGRKHETADQEIKFLDERINALFTDLNDVQQQMADYKERYNLMGIEQQAQVLAESATMNQAEAVKSQAQMLYYEEVLRQLRNPSRADSRLPVFSSEASEIITEYNQLLLDKKELERSAKEGNPQLTAINNKVAEARAAAIEFVSGMLSEARIAEREQSNLINSSAGRLRSLPKYEKEYINLYRDQSLKNELYVFLLEKRESAVLQLYSENTLGFIVDEAYTAVKPIRTKKIIVMALCVIMGLLIPSCVVLWMMFRRRNRVYEPMDVAFIGCEKHAVMFSGNDCSTDANKIRTLLLEHGRKGIFISDFCEEDSVAADIEESFRLAGQSVVTLSPHSLNLPETNDSLLHEVFAEKMNSEKNHGQVTFVNIPSPERTYELVTSVNKQHNALLVILRSGQVSRPDLRKYFRDIESSHIYFCIVDQAKK